MSTPSPIRLDAAAGGGAAELLAKLPTHDRTSAIGGRARRPDAARFDPAYPMMATWAAAGVHGGIPSDPPVVALVEGGTGHEIQKAIDHAALRGGGTVLLAAGDYPIEETLRMPSGVLLRGTWADQVRLEGRMRHGFAGWSSAAPDDVPARGAIIEMAGAERAGVAHLTVIYDRTLPPPPQGRRGDPSFADKPHGRDDLFVMGIRLDRCADCWVEGCRIIDSGTNPVELLRSRHCTVRGCEISGSHNQGGGQGYVHLNRSSHCLLADLVISDCRHLTIQDGTASHPCQGNVIVACDLRVDVNFHSGDSGSNLVQDCRIHIPTWHWWGPFALGDPRIHRPPGPGNLIHGCDARRFRAPGFAPGPNPCDGAMVYAIHAGWERPSVREQGPAPIGGTLYATAT